MGWGSSRQEPPAPQRGRESFKSTWRCPSPSRWGSTQDQWPGDEMSATGCSADRRLGLFGGGHRPLADIQPGVINDCDAAVAASHGRTVNLRSVAHSSRPSARGLTPPATASKLLLTFALHHHFRAARTAASFAGELELSTLSCPSADDHGRQLCSGCCRWPPTFELTVSDTLQSLGHVCGVATTGR